MRCMDEKFFAHTRFQPYGTAVMFLGIVLHKLFSSLIFIHPKIFFKLLTTIWLYSHSFVSSSAVWNSQVRFIRYCV
jgi:hypothetical protein